MLDIPRVIYGSSLLRNEAHNARLMDVRYPIRALPRGGELVSPLGTLFPPEDPISNFKVPGYYAPAMIAAQPLLIPS